LQEHLDDSRKYVLAEDQEHTYDDKFSLVEYMTHAAWRSLADAYEMLGFDIVKLLQDKNSDDEAATPIMSIILYFEGSVQCNFIEQRQAEVIGDGYETTITTAGGGYMYGQRSVKEETRRIHRYTEYVWNVTQSYHVYACLSTEADSSGDSLSSASSCKDIDDDDSINNGTKIRRVDIARRSMSTTVSSQEKDSPPYATFGPTMERIRLPTWWIQQMTTLFTPTSKSSNQQQQLFVIRRELESCKTPRRNEDVQTVLDFHQRLFNWHSHIITFIAYMMYINKPGESKTSIDNYPLFHHPIIPIVIENSTESLLPASHLDRILAEQKQLLQQKVDALKEVYPNPNDHPDAMYSFAEASLCLQMRHLNGLLDFHGQSVGHVEEMLRQQLAQAVGKQLNEQDFHEYMEFHNSHRLFHKDYAPKPFSWAIRARPDQYPVGIVSIESKNSNEQQRPISTLTRHIPTTNTTPPITIPINAATAVQLTGDRYLSGWIRYEFESGKMNSNSFHVAARARQFSSFMILVGTMTGPDTFDPKHAMILQNKDEVLIDLITDVLPSAKQFKDAIASLSPEQQEFARAYRAMQLESSVFAIAVIQLKPQFEKLLGLPNGALDKEIALTENLMKLFVDFQIPSDLLSYKDDHVSTIAGGNVTITTSDKVEMVKGYVKSVMDVIESLKEQELEEEKQKAKARKTMSDDSSAEPSSAPSSTRIRYDSPEAGTSGGYLYSSSVTPTSGPSAGPNASPSAGPSASPTMLRSSTPPRQMALREISDKNAKRSLDFVDGPATTQSLPSQGDSGGEDFTLLPRILDAKLEKYDTDGYLRSTVIKAWTSSWKLQRQKNLLTAPTSEILNEVDVASETKRAFDLLDAISKFAALFERFP
jgi:hypothetical protein